MGIGKAVFVAALAIFSYGIYVSVTKPKEEVRLEGLSNKIYLFSTSWRRMVGDVLNV